MPASRSMPRGRHRWRPLAPLCDVEVRFAAPALSWRGTGYFDHNEGDEPLEAGFHEWTWTRFEAGDSARIFYDVVQRDGAKRGLALAARGGLMTATDSVGTQELARTGWGVARAVPCEMGGSPSLNRTLENAPF